VTAWRRRLLGPALFSLCGFIVLIGLGTWQLERKAWKDALIETLSQRIAAVPGDLPLPRDWTSLDSANDEFRRVRFAAEFLHGQEALVYTVGSALRSDVSGPGYWVVTPARIAGGGLVAVNRGFIPEGRRDPASRAKGQVIGTVALVGALRWPEPRGWFTPKDQPERNVWFVRDHLAIGAAKDWGEIAPFYVEQEAPIPPGGLPQPGALTVKLRNEHLQYALTWYGLALVLLAVFAAWTMSRRDGALSPR
jgi:surfeit locus 1 family protein